MCESLPIGEFEWIVDSYSVDFLGTPDDADYGFILECDLFYDPILFEDHKDLPLLPQKMIPPLSKSKTVKLLTTLFDKKNYIIH